MKKLLTGVVLSVSLVGLSGCAWLDSAQKTYESDTKGLHRSIEVYSVTGELLGEYEGEKVRIESENEGGKVSIMVNGKRMSFYNATVIVEEK